MITEISTLCVNNRVLMLDLDLHDLNIKWKKRYKYNGYLLITAFFLSRIVFLGVILGYYVLPLLLNYDYE
jgi:uncharacterized membrane protein